jgi:hypothetical protein
MVFIMMIEFVSRLLIQLILAFVVIAVMEVFGMVALIFLAFLFPPPFPIDKRPIEVNPIDADRALLVTV